MSKKLKYKCPRCSVKSYLKHWNEATRKRYGRNGEISEVQDEENNSFHICPSCGSESEMFKKELIEGLGDVQDDR